MPKMEKILQGDSAKGVAIGVGAVLVGLAAIPTLIMVGRPVARVAIKSGILFLEKGREAMAIATESLDDLVAEVQSELVTARGSETGSSEETKSE